MKRVIAFLLVCVMILTSCVNTNSNTDVADSKESIENSTSTIEESDSHEQEYETIEPEVTETITLEEYQAEIPEFTGMSDETLLRYVEDNIYAELISELDSEEYYISDVSAVYVSKEYLEEVAYNSQSNIFFGYTLAELDDQFQGTQYVFCLGEDGTTVVKEFESYDDTYERIIEDVVIGTGVILVSVTVSVVSGGVGAPAVSMIFATSAKSGAIFALSSGALGGVAAGVVTGVQTRDIDQVVKAGALAGSEGFKWGAISGAVLGGASKLVALRGATLNGLTRNEAAIIQKESGYPLDLINQFKSMKEYEIYKEAGLTTKMVNGRLALVRDIDLTYKSDLAGETVTNLERMKEGYAAIDPVTGKSYQLHHINQEVDGTLAILAGSEHQVNASILDTVGKEGVHKILSDYEWAKIRSVFWKSFADGLGGVSL
jgi:hypothetical protein